MHILELRTPPPIVLLLAGALMWLIARALPVLAVNVPGRGVLALVIGLLGLPVSIAGAVAFHRAGTTTNPMKPDKASLLVVSGIYTRTRNPMYLGLTIILFGWAIFLAHPLALLGLPCFVVYINRFQITPEERMLRAKFGADFQSYCDKVPRWL